MLCAYEIGIGLVTSSVDLPMPLNTSLEHFADISHELIVELLLRPLDADPFHVFGNEIETLIREVEIIGCPRHRHAELLDQGVGMSNQLVLERRVVDPMPDRAVAPMLIVLTGPRRPSHQAVEGLGRIDIALPSEG